VAPLASGAPQQCNGTAILLQAYVKSEGWHEHGRAPKRLGMRARSLKRLASAFLFCGDPKHLPPRVMKCKVLKTGAAFRGFLDPRTSCFRRAAASMFHVATV